MVGFGLNLKLDLYLKSHSLAESLGFLNSPLLQVSKLWKLEYFIKSNNYLQIKISQTQLFAYKHY